MALLQPCRAHVAGQGIREPFPALLVHPTPRSSDLSHQMSTQQLALTLLKLWVNRSLLIMEMSTWWALQGRSLCPLEHSRVGDTGWFMAAVKATWKATWGWWLNMAMVYSTLFSSLAASPGMWWHLRFARDTLGCVTAPKPPVHCMHGLALLNCSRCRTWGCLLHSL